MEKITNKNSIREFEACLEISADILYDLIGNSRNSYYRKHTANMVAENYFSRYINSNINCYLSKDNNSSVLLGGEMELNVSYYNDLYADILELKTNATQKNKEGEDIEVELSIIYHSDPEVETSETEQALYSIAMDEKHGENPSLLQIKGDVKMLDLLQKPDLYKGLLGEVKNSFKNLSTMEKILSGGCLKKIHERLLQISRHIINNGFGVTDADRNWFILISDYVMKYSRVIEKDPDVVDKKAKHRTLVLYLYLKAKSGNPEDDFSSQEALYKFIASVVGSTPDSVKQYILALGKNNIGYKLQEHFEKAKLSLLHEFEKVNKPLKESIKSYLDRIHCKN